MLQAVLSLYFPYYSATTTESLIYLSVVANGRVREKKVTAAQILDLNKKY